MRNNSEGVPGRAIRRRTAIFGMVAAVTLPTACTLDQPEPRLSAAECEAFDDGRSCDDGTAATSTPRESTAPRTSTEPSTTITETAPTVTTTPTTTTTAPRRTETHTPPPTTVTPAPSTVTAPQPPPVTQAPPPPTEPALPANFEALPDFSDPNAANNSCTSLGGRPYILPLYASPSCDSGEALNYNNSTPMEYDPAMNPTPDQILVYCETTDASGIPWLDVVDQETGLRGYTPKVATSVSSLAIAAC